MQATKPSLLQIKQLYIVYHIVYHQICHHVSVFWCYIIYFFLVSKTYFLVLLLGLVFEVDKDGNLPLHVVYKIRQNSTFTARTDLIRRRFWQPGSEHHRVIGYYTYGFVWLQDIVERAIIDKRVGRRVTEPGGYVEEIPYPCYLQDK